MRKVEFEFDIGQEVEVIGRGITGKIDRLVLAGTRKLARFVGTRPNGKSCGLIHFEESELKLATKAVSLSGKKDKNVGYVDKKPASKPTP